MKTVITQYTLESLDVYHEGTNYLKIILSKTCQIFSQSSPEATHQHSQILWLNHKPKLADCLFSWLDASNTSRCKVSVSNAWVEQEDRQTTKQAQQA